MTQSPKPQKKSCFFCVIFSFKTKTFRLYFLRPTHAKITCTSLIPWCNKSKFVRKSAFFIYIYIANFSYSLCCNFVYFPAFESASKKLSCLRRFHLQNFRIKFGSNETSDFDSILCNISKFNGKISFRDVCKMRTQHINIFGTKIKSRAREVFACRE